MPARPGSRSAPRPAGPPRTGAWASTRWSPPATPRRSRESSARTGAVSSAASRWAGVPISTAGPGSTRRSAAGSTEPTGSASEHCAARSIPPASFATRCRPRDGGLEARVSGDLWDVAIVGAGPVGSTCAWYLAGRGLSVLLLDKQQFPRDKLCGDAITTRAQHHLERMGVLAEVLAAGEGHWAEVGGFVSPSGLGYVADSTVGGALPLVIAIKRLALDVRVARAAERAGARLVESAPVGRAAFSSEARAWRIDEAGGGGRSWRARVLVIADGALSRLARALGLVPDAPDAVCSRAYVEAGSADFAVDGLVFYPRGLLPGYCALFREADGDL